MKRSEDKMMLLCQWEEGGMYVRGQMEERCLCVDGKNGTSPCQVSGRNFAPVSKVRGWNVAPESKVSGINSAPVSVEQWCFCVSDQYQEDVPVSEVSVEIVNSHCFFVAIFTGSMSCAAFLLQING